MKSAPPRGFTLVELAIVTLIIGMLLSGILISITASQDQRNTEETQKSLAQVVDAIYGFAAVNGRMPCPATATSGGRESFCTNDVGACGAELFVPPATHGRCTAQFDGFVPAATLGISPTDPQGIAVDAWANRIRYAVTDQNTFAFTRAPTATAGIQAIWRDPLQGPTSLTPDLQICTTAGGITGAGTAAATCTAATQLTTRAVAVVLSTGKNGQAAPADADETANAVGSNDRVFVSHNPTPTFNDQVLWISANVLYNRMIAAGRLP
jgi:prepilin-type N-terminal cleavage/methylation domain-containing protein